jgi:GNAT superfamily N-acetyltransferase
VAIEIKPLPPKDIVRITEVDSSQHVKAVYRAESTSDGLGLTLKRLPQNPPIEIPAWGKLGTRNRIERWRPQLERGGLLFGALDGERLIGFSILGPSYRDGSAELVALFIHADYRSTGLGSRLLGEVKGLAELRGDKHLYAYSNPTGTSVDFLLRHGFRAIGMLDKRVVTHLPWDLIFVCQLGKAADRAKR